MSGFKIAATLRPLGLQLCNLTATYVLAIGRDAILCHI